MKPLIIALDVDTESEALAILKATKRSADIYKVGPPLLLRGGPAFIKKIAAQGKKIFLDLKFHDIPNTMLRSVKEAGALGIYSATVHLTSGETALKETVGASKRPKIWGVTVLTSLQHDDLITIGIDRAPQDQVLRLALLAKRVGLDGIVASVGETAHLRAQLGAAFPIITPGIRLPHQDVGDQKRVATPSHAREAGATFIVVGRPILEANDPGSAAEEILRDWGH